MHIWKCFGKRLQWVTTNPYRAELLRHWRAPASSQYCRRPGCRAGPELPAHAVGGGRTGISRSSQARWFCCSRSPIGTFPSAQKAPCTPSRPVLTPQRQPWTVGISTSTSSQPVLELHRNGIFAMCALESASSQAPWGLWALPMLLGVWLAHSFCCPEALNCTELQQFIYFSCRWTSV